MTMKKTIFALMCLASLTMLTACGDKASKTGDTTDNSPAASGDLKDGQWPASVYDIYGVDEIKTQGKVVLTNFQTDGVNQYEVFYAGVTKDEILAYIDALKAKGFRMSKTDEEVLQNNTSEQVGLYQPGEKKDMKLCLYYNFRDSETIEVEEGKEIAYNFRVFLEPLENDAYTSGSLEGLGLTPDDFKDMTGVRYVSMYDDAATPSFDLGYFADHMITEQDMKALNEKLADLLASKGGKFRRVLGGDELTLEEIKAEDVRTYMVELLGKQYMMMPATDSQPGDFGGEIKFQFTAATR